MAVESKGLLAEASVAGTPAYTLPYMAGTPAYTLPNMAGTPARTPFYYGRYALRYAHTSPFLKWQAAICTGLKAQAASAPCQPVARCWMTPVQATTPHLAPMMRHCRRLRHRLRSRYHPRRLGRWGFLSGSLQQWSSPAFCLALAETSSNLGLRARWVRLLLSLPSYS